MVFLEKHQITIFFYQKHIKYFLKATFYYGQLNREIKKKTKHNVHILPNVLMFIRAK